MKINLLLIIPCLVNCVFSILLVPSPTAKFRIHTSNVFNCSVDNDWEVVIYNLKQHGLAIVLGFFTDTNGACKNHIQPYEQYRTGCDYSTRTFFLILNNVTFDDDGSFLTCQATYKLSSGNEKADTTIDVQYPPAEPPSITRTPGEPTLEGNTVVLTCEIPGGNPLSIIHWKCDGFTESVTTTTIPLTNKAVSSIEKTLTKIDNYKECTCVGNHLFWTESIETKYTLIVYYPPSITISPTYAQYEVIENTTNLELDCKVLDSNPAVVSFRWYKEGVVIDGYTDALYTIPTVQRSHTGNYTCDATNVVGTSDPASTVQLNVLYISDINPINKQEPTESTQLSVSCNAKSYPEVQNNDVTWIKLNNETFFMKGQQLVIQNVHRIDSGTYICSVMLTLIPTIGQSVNYTRTATVELDVLYRPTVTVSPDFNTYKVIENSTNLHLTCKVIESNPVATSYRWYKDDSNISSKSIYTMLTVHRSQTGNYTCAATNVVGTSSSSSILQLIVLYGVELNSISKKNQSVGKQLTVTSTGLSYPVITRRDFKWTKQNNNTFSMVGQQLVIDNVNKIDTGTYVCSVVLQLTPSVGQPVNVTGTTTVDVDILYRPDVTIYPVQNPYEVIENTTTFHLTCTITEANPAVMSYRWYKDGVKVSTAATYIIPKVYRYHTGSYTCDASNTVGISDSSSVLQLNVLYGVVLILSRSEINIDESDRWDFSCIGDGNPLPNIVCVYGNNGTTVGEQKNNAIAISFDHANCVDTGYYVCSGNNTISEPVSQSAEIKVACKPRTYNNVDTEDIFMRTTDEGINISTTFISFPLSHISWSRELSDGHLADLDSSFKYFTIRSHLPYETIAILQKDQLKPNEFGIYLVNASNIYGSFLMKYHFIQKRDPILPSYVYVVCKTTTAIVILKPIVNEDLPQDLYIQYAVDGKNMISIKVYTNDSNQQNEYTVTGLNPQRKYNFSILAVNQYGETRSNQFQCLTETLSYSEDMLAVKQDNGSMFSAGIASLVVGLLFFVAATIFIFRKRFKKTYTKSSKSDDYADLQASNPAFQDPYTSIHNPIESRHHQESSANTYEECGNASDAAAYQNIENMKSGHKKEEKNLGIYDNMKI